VIHAVAALETVAARDAVAATVQAAEEQNVLPWTIQARGSSFAFSEVDWVLPLESSTPAAAEPPDGSTC
jgi:hypothetical protein